VPNGGDEIPEMDNNTAELQGDMDWLGLYVDPQSVLTSSIDFHGTVPASVAAYDLWLTLNTKGASPTRPYNVLTIGGPDRRIFLASSSERIVIDCAKRLAYLTDAAGVFQRYIGYVVKSDVVIDDAQSSAITLVDGRWLPIMQDNGATSQIQLSDPSGTAWGSVSFTMTGRLGYLI
jgi:hypothetical protein